MVRRIPTQVHQQISRLMRAGYIKNKPLWFDAVLSHPPLPLPPKSPPARTSYDLQVKGPNSSHSKSCKFRPLPIHYSEDVIRRQFFRDHPFEAFRPTTLVEGARISDLHSIRGKDWKRLRQRGRNPSPEDAVQFTITLHEHHEIPLPEAYILAVTQFRAIRSEHLIASKFAALEAEHLGGVYSAGDIEHAFKKEKRGLATFGRREEIDEGAMAARKRWKTIIERRHDSKEWSRGVKYISLWEEGVRPTYSPTLTETVNSPSRDQGTSYDYLNILR